MDTIRKTIYDIDLTKQLQRIFSGNLLARNDKRANRMGVNVFQNGQAVSLSGFAVKGYFIRHGVKTIVLKGVVDGNMAYVDLDARCYRKDGSYTLSVVLCKDGRELTLVIFDGRVTETCTDAIVENENTLSLADLAQHEWVQNVLDAADNALEQANNAAASAAEAQAIKDRVLEDYENVFAQDVNKTVGDWLNDHPEATTTVQDGSLGIGKFVVGALGWVSPEMFGAVGDGVTNDYQAIKDCIIYANAHNCEVRFAPKTYSITGDPIGVQANLYGSGCTIKLGNTSAATPLFVVRQSTEETTTALWEDVFVDINTVKDNFKNSAFICKTYLSLGYRYGDAGNEEYFVKVPIYTNDDNKVAWPKSLPTTGTEIEIAKKSDIFEKGIVIQGFNVVCDNTYFPQFLSIERNNCIVKNIKYDAYSIRANRQGYFINAQNCNNVLFDDLILKASGEETSVWKYCLSFYNCSNITVRNSVITSPWGHALSSNTIYNIKYDNVIADGVDCHVNQYGSVIIDNCNLGSVYVGFGEGCVIARNSIFNSNIGFTARNDYASRFSGLIKAENCKFAHYGYSDHSINDEIMRDGNRNPIFNNVTLPRIEFVDCEMDRPVRFNQITGDIFTVEYNPVIINHSKFANLGTYDGTSYSYVYPKYVIKNCDFTFEGFGDLVHVIDSKVVFNPTQNGNRYPANKVVFERCSLRFDYFSKPSDILMRQCVITYANYSSVKANSLTYIDCSGKIEACANYLYVFGGQYNACVYNSAPTGAIINAVFDKTASFKKAATIMTLNVLDADFTQELIPLRNQQDITQRPSFDDILEMY